MTRLQSINWPKSFAFLGIFLVLGVASFSMYYIYDAIGLLGQNIPQASFATGYTTALAWALGIGVVLSVVPANRAEHRALLYLWVARCFITLVFMLFYEYFYLLDAYNYYEGSLNPYFDTSAVKFGKGTVNVAWFTWMLNQYLPVYDSYHAIKVIYSFIGLAGTYTFYRAFSLYIGKRNVYHLYFLGLFPSMLFWSSILGKDPIVFLGIAIYTYGVLGILKTHRPNYLLTIFAGIMLAASVRIWTGIIMTAPLALAYTIGGTKKTSQRFAYMTIIFLVTAYTMNSFLDKFDIESTDSLVSRSAMVAGGWAEGGSAQEVQKFTSFFDMMKFAPKGMVAALFRPLPFEINNAFGFIAGLENLFILFLLIYAIKRFNPIILRRPGITWAISFVVIWSFIYGFASYQNLGTAARFKLQVLPILLTLLLFIIFRDSLVDEDSKDSNPDDSKGSTVVALPESRALTIEPPKDNAY